MAKKDWMVSQADLDDDQLSVLQATLNKSCIVTGCAGSGKSVLALIKAQRIQKEKGNDYQIIVFTKSLCRYMNAGREELGLKNDFDYHWNWKNKKDCPKSLYVIVDEIQDFSKDEIIEFVNATKGCFFFFGDTAQSLYEGLKPDLIEVEKLPTLSCISTRNYKTFELYRNYRLPLAVARAAYYIDQTQNDSFNESIYKSKETAMPFLWHFQDLDAQIAQIAQILKNDSSKTDVAILLPHGDAVRHISDLLRQCGIKCECKYTDKEDWHQSVDTLDFSTTSPKVMTYHSAKGLQFETVFLPDISPLDPNHPDSDQRALYVAMTRTYRYLYIMYSGILPAPLANIPDRDSLFRCRTFGSSTDGRTVSSDKSTNLPF